VVGGQAVERAAVEASGFKGVALEASTLLTRYTYRHAEYVLQLGGKDPAYVRPDADLDYTAAELVDGQASPIP